MSVFFKSSTTFSPNEIARSLIEELDEASLHPNIDFKKLITQAKDCTHLYKGQITEGLRQELKSRVDALRFQTGILKQEKNPELRSIRLETLKEKLSHWQLKNLWFSPNQNLLNQEILKKLETHPHLIKRLIGSDELLDRFARFTLVYHCGDASSIEIFANYTSIAAKIDLAGLVPAIGQYKGLELHKNNVFLKKEGSLVNISDDSLVTVLKRMEKENHKDTDRECPFFYGPDGISHFNRYLNGSEIDLEKKDYYKEIPKTGIFLSYAEMQEKLPNLKEGEWAFTMKAGRCNEGLSAKETHSWIEIYKPTEKNKYELLMSVGLWEKKVPTSKWEWFKIVMGSTPATIAVFENRILDRIHQVRSEWFSLSEEEALNAVQEKIRTKLIDARNDLIPFQVCAHNCLQFAANLTREVVGEKRFNEQIPPSHLSCSLFEVEVDSTVRSIFSIIQGLPKVLSIPFYWLLKTMAGQYSPFTVKDFNGELRKITVANDSDFGRTNQIPLPSHFIASKDSISSAIPSEVFFRGE